MSIRGSVFTGVLAVWVATGGCVADTVPLDLVEVARPIISVSPEALDFGPLRRGQSRQMIVTIENLGEAPLNVDGLALSAPDEFQLDEVDVGQIPPGGRIQLVVSYTTSEEPGVQEGEIVVFSDDPFKPQVPITLVAETLGPSLCRFRVEPREVDFGEVSSNDQARQVVRIESIGTGDCQFRNFRIESPTGAFSISSPLPPQVNLPPGRSFEITVAYRPQTEQDTGRLDFDTNDARFPDVSIPLFGIAQLIVPVQCAGSEVTSAGVPVEVFAISPAEIVSWRWEIVDAPSGGIGTPDQWSPNPPETSRVEFLGFILGTYRLRATVTDVEGHAGACEIDVQVRGNGFQVTLTWDGLGDVDLHVHNGSNTAWFTTDDCYYANRRPIWDRTSEAAEGGNPELDFDNTRQEGPENTRVQAVEIGKSYFVGIHNFNRAQGRRATVQIFCGQDVEPDLEMTSRVFQGVSSGDNSDNEFWKVAEVVFTSASTCDVNVLDQYVTAADANRAR